MASRSFVNLKSQQFLTSPQKSSTRFVVFPSNGRSGFMSNNEASPSQRPDAHPPAVGDKVIESLLAQGLVSETKVKEAATLRIQMYHEGDLQPVWRWLVWGAGVDREAIYRVAAEVYDYKRVSTRSDLLKPFIRRIQPCFSLKLWRKMGELGVVPIKGTSSGNASRIWSFAAYDPTSKHVHQVVRQCVGRDYLLYQADREWVVNLITEAMISHLEIPAKRQRGGQFPCP